VPAPPVGADGAALGGGGDVSVGFNAAANSASSARRSVGSVAGDGPLGERALSDGAGEGVVEGTGSGSEGLAGGSWATARLLQARVASGKANL
jgi:hypothetical protein